MYKATFITPDVVWEGRYGTLEALKLDALMFIKKHNLSASTWNAPDIYMDGRKGPLFTISYNGRIWTENEFPVDVDNKKLINWVVDGLTLMEECNAVQQPTPPGQV